MSVSGVCRQRASGGIACVVIVAMFLCSPVLGAARPSLTRWLSGVRSEGISRGISAATIDKALAGFSPIPRVVELDRNQPEFSLTLREYLDGTVSAGRIAKGRRMLDENRALLTELSRRYGVPGNVLVAFWGIETDYGRNTGGFPVVRSVATLAFHGRRSTFFRTELFHALRILDEGHISVDKMTGSWAGAMGQVQFMPSSFKHFAVDYDGDGRRDIWKSREDALASAANYLSKSGWVPRRRWGREVVLPRGFDETLVGTRIVKRLDRWQSLGVRCLDGSDLPLVDDMRGSIVTPDGAGGRAFLVYENFHVILKWNRSHYFGVAVGMLADRLGERE